MEGPLGRDDFFAVHGVGDFVRFAARSDAGKHSKSSPAVTWTGVLCVSQPRSGAVEPEKPSPALFAASRNTQIPCLVQPRRINSLWPAKDGVAWTRISSPSVIHEGLCMIPTATRRLDEPRMSRRSGQNHTQASLHDTSEGLCVVANLVGSHSIVHKPLRVTREPEVLSLDPDLTCHSTNWASRKSSCRMM